MKSDNFENELPEGYELKLHIDAKDKKTTVIYLLVSFLPMIVTIVIALLLIAFVRDVGAVVEPSGFATFIWLIIVMAVLSLYMVLHELVHGVTYKALTGGKLTFGLRWNVAFCGVPDIFVYRKTAKIAVLMPFIVFTIIFVGLTVGMYFVDGRAFFGAAFVLGMHIGGCVGDLHVAYMLDHKFKDNKTLMRDTGPEQFFYVYTGVANSDIAE